MRSRSDAGGFDRPAFDFVNHLVGVDEDFLQVGRIDDVVAGDAADDALAELDDFVLALVNGLDPDAVAGAAILHADDDVLGDVHQFAGHVAGVGGFEGGVGQALAGAVGGDEIFQDGEALAEVGENGLFDDVAAGFGHEAAHAGELADLLAVAAGAGIHHERDGVVFELAMVVLQGVQHDVGDLVGATGPDINDLVVTLAGGDDAFAVLLFDLGNLFLRVVDFLVLFLRG